MSNEIVSRWHVVVPAGQTVHLRSEDKNNASNVITELPNNYPLVNKGGGDPFKPFVVDDCIDEIEGYIHNNYTSPGLGGAVAADEIWYPRYSTTAWKRSKHGKKKYLPVQRIQEDLYKLGYTVVGKADGYYGANTEKAAKAFQSANGLTADGIFGKNSKQKLWDLTDRKG